jgi:hypothetical protein
VDIGPGVHIQAAQQTDNLAPVPGETGLMIPFAQLIAKMPDDFGPIKGLQQDGELGRAVPLPRFLGRDTIARGHGLLQDMEAEKVKEQILPAPSIRGEKSFAMEFAGLAFDDADKGKTAVAREG